MSSPNQVLPSTTVAEVAPGPAFAASRSEEIPVFAGCSSKGPLNTPTSFGPSDIADLVSQYGCGPAVKEAAYFAAKVAQKYVFLRLLAAAVAGTLSAVTVTRTSSGSAPTNTITGTPLDGADVVILYGVTGGVTGTGPIAYQISLDGGNTYGMTQALGTATTIVILGVTLTLGTSKTITAGDTTAWFQTVASQTILPLNTSGVIGSSTITASGTPNDAYEVAWKCVDDGAGGAGTTIGVAGIKFQYALDYLAPVPTWSPTIALGTASSYAVPDGPIDTSLTGVTIDFGAGSIKTGDIVTFNTTGPVPNSAGITNGLSGPTPQTNPVTGLIANRVAFTGIRLIGGQPEAVVASADSIVSGWDSTNKDFTWMVMDARDHATTETLSAWSARCQSDFAAYTSKWTGVCGGMARVTCPINGRNNRRPSMAAITPRAFAWPIQWDWARYDQGPLGADVSLTNGSNQVVEHDANTDPGLNAMGFITLRHWPGATGIFPTQASLLGPDNDIKLIPLRRVLNVAKETQQAIQQLQAVINLRVYKAGDPKIPNGFAAGDIVMADINKIRRLGNAMFQSSLVSSGLASGFVWTVQQTPISLGGGNYQLKDALQVTPLIYVVTVTGTAQLVSGSLTI
jgi:hypothetical protein